MVKGLLWPLTIQKNREMVPKKIATPVRRFGEVSERRGAKKRA